MDLALITAQQVAELFILMGLGALGAKTGLLRPEGKQTLSNLLVNLVVPAMIINSYRMDFSPEILRNLLAAFALSILSSLLGLVITLLFTARSKDSRTPIFRFACIFSNAGYMGLPLISALFGSEGLLYASAYFTIFNLLLWTLGYSIVSGSSDPKRWPEVCCAARPSTPSSWASSSTSSRSRCPLSSPSQWSFWAT